MRAPRHAPRTFHRLCRWGSLVLLLGGAGVLFFGAALPAGLLAGLGLLLCLLPHVSDHPREAAVTASGAPGRRTQ